MGDASPARPGKLVRDKIPDIITAGGGVANTHVLDEKQYLRSLVDKLDEECAEFKEALDLEELADIQEVVLALADMIASRERLEKVRIAKLEQRGGFDKRLFLERGEV